MDIYDHAQSDGIPKNVIRGREPGRGSQICGEQTEYGNGRGEQYCGELKAPGLHRCHEHHDAVLAEYGEVRVAPGSAIGTGK